MISSSNIFLFLKDYIIPILVLTLDCETDFICLNLLKKYINNKLSMDNVLMLKTKSFERKVFNFQNVFVRQDNIKK